jgi:hypothetical protein
MIVDFISAVVLFLVTTIVIYNILKLLTSTSKPEKKVNLWKILLQSSLISAIFTVFITIISIKVEKKISLKSIE